MVIRQKSNAQILPDCANSCAIGKSAPDVRPDRQSVGGAVSAAIRPYHSIATRDQSMGLENKKGFSSRPSRSQAHPGSLYIASRSHEKSPHVRKIRIMKKKKKKGK